ncbi:hypothetical protein MJO28_005949 [Puccinia striiformis f. sp. tritici]|uniref:Uncharacterized protein n=1 Tax=Puccinia striiformis f. sp. tritici TaxID=168172 RepID=A0ACC0EFJ1_9BASI|nr:hypothetical protein MJO28_005949 [Puccinia striiformis f. sp. tritici]
MRRSSAWLSSLIVSTLTLTSSISAQDSSNNSTATPSNLANLPGFDSTINSTPSSSSNATNHTTATTGNNTSTDTNPGSNLRIPTTISQSCQDFLGQLNANPNITSCTAPLLNATASFASGPQSVTPEQVKKAFDGLYGANSGSGCAPHMMYNLLNQFTSSCNSELQGGVEVVRMAYDVLYILTPYRVALCSKDPSTGEYCPSVIASAIVNGTTTPSSSSAGKSANSSASDFGAMVSSVFGDKLVTQLGGSNPTQPALRTRDSIPANSTTTSAQQQIYNPNPDTYTNTNLAFLFLSPYLSDKALCKPCTQSVLAAYIGFEQATPHYGGLASSGYLSGQLKLWKSVSDRCGAAFIEAINQEAGIMSILTTSAANAFNLILKNSVNLATLSFFFLSIRFLHLI